MLTSRALVVAVALAGCSQESPPPPEHLPYSHGDPPGLPLVEPPNARPKVVSLENFPIGGNGHAETWDGRVFVGTMGFSRWGVTAFRPEVLVDGQTDGGLPTFAEAFSEMVELDPSYVIPSPLPRLDPCPEKSPSPTPSPSPEPPRDSASGLLCKNSLSLVAVPERAVNPYPCDAGGHDGGGPNQCYEVFVVAPSCGTTGAMGRFRAVIIVGNPGQPDAFIAGTQVKERFQTFFISRWRDASGTLTTTRPATELDDRLMGLEPTVSFDGRLMIWNGNLANTGTSVCTAKLLSYLVYSWNPDPMRLDGWSQPSHVSDMSRLEAQSLVADIPFPERYPLAQRDMRDALGERYPAQGGLWGAYPWLSLDGTELVYAAVSRSPETQPNQAGPGETRAGISIVGRWTGWATRHIDGPTNFDRLTPKLFYSSPGAKPSFWSPYPTLRDPLRQLPLPYTAGRPVYPLFGSNTSDYSEVSLEDTVDGDYLVSLHMNELVRNDCGSGECRGAYDLPAAELQRTPDTSGNFFTGELRGAMFPGEDRPTAASNGLYGCNDDLDGDGNGRKDCMDPVCAITPYCENRERAVNCERCDRVECFDELGFCADGRPRGFVGQAIQFKNGDWVRVANAPALSSAESFTVELAVYPAASASGCFGEGYTLAEHPGRWRLAVDGKGRIGATVWSGSKPRGITGVGLLPCRAWSHVAFSYEKSGWLAVYIDGTQREERELGAGLAAPATDDLAIGPRGLSGAGRPVLLLDEFRLSRVLRTPSEIKRAAYAAPAHPSLAPPPPSLPAGLDARDLRVPSNNPPDDRKAALGRFLFFDPRLSRNGEISCGTCHQPGLGFSDEYPLSRGLDGRILTRRTPHLVNRAFGWTQFWDGRAGSLEDQVELPIDNPNEMAFSIEEALALARETPDYAAAFQAAFNRPVDATAFGQALAQWIRTLNSGASTGDAALSGDARLGQILFSGKARCTACHWGSNFSDEIYHASRTSIDEADLGRGKVTGRTADLRAFKTPSLRDVARRRFYFHDGSADNLREVVRRYNLGGFSTLGRDPEIRPLGLTDVEIDQVVAYLQSLDGTSLPSTEPPPLPDRTPPAQLRNQRFDAQLSYFTVVRGFYQPDPQHQSWYASEAELGSRRMPPETSLVRLGPTLDQPAWLEQTLQLPSKGAPQTVRARVSQLLDNGHATELVLSVREGDTTLFEERSGPIDFARGWIELGVSGNLASCGGASCAGRRLTFRVTAPAGSTEAPGVSQLEVF